MLLLQSLLYMHTAYLITNMAGAYPPCGGPGSFEQPKMYYTLSRTNYL